MPSGDNVLFAAAIIVLVAFAPVGAVYGLNEGEIDDLHLFRSGLPGEPVPTRAFRRREP